MSFLFFMGIASSSDFFQVDHVNFVFSDSALVFAPWNDEVYSPRTNGSNGSVKGSVVCSVANVSV